MASSVPALPRIFFTYVEPVLCVIGTLQIVLNPESITELLPLHLGGRTEFHAHPTPLEHLLALQYAGLLLLIGMTTLVIMLYGNKDLIKAFMAVSLITDFGHWGAFAYVLGTEGLQKWQGWNGGLWGQLLVPTIAFSLRIGYLSGALGDGEVVRTEKKRA